MLFKNSLRITLSLIWYIWPLPTVYPLELVHVQLLMVEEAFTDCLGMDVLQEGCHLHNHGSQSVYDAVPIDMMITNNTTIIMGPSYRYKPKLIKLYMLNLLALDLVHTLRKGQ